MNNFRFENKTSVYFGKGCVQESLGGLLENYGDTVLLAYGGGSIKRNGIYDEVCGILQSTDKNIVEFSGFDLVLVREDGSVWITEGLEDGLDFRGEEAGYTYEIIRR